MFHRAGSLLDDSLLKPHSPEPTTLFALLDSPDSMLEDVLREPSLCTAFKSNSSSLIRYLQVPMMFWTLMDLFRDSRDPIIISAIGALFLSPNPLFLQRVASESELLEFFCQMIFDADTTIDLTIGFISQILTAATQKFPSSFYALIYRSPTFFPLLLLRIDRRPMAALAAAISQSPTPKEHSFLWGYFLALLPDRRSEVLPPGPWKVDFDGVIASATTPLTPMHRIRLLALFQSFVQCFPDEAEFVHKNLGGIMAMLTTDAEISAGIRLGLVLPKDPCIEDAALSVIARDPVVPASILENAIAYVTANFEAEYVRVVTIFLYNFLMEDISNNFLWAEVIKLTDAFVHHRGVDGFFRAELQHFVAYTWNRKGEDCPLLKRSFLLRLAEQCDGKASFPGWTSFVSSVIAPYRSHSQIPRDFQIPEKHMNPTLIAILSHTRDIKSLWVESFGTRKSKRRGTRSVGPDRFPMIAPPDRRSISLSQPLFPAMHSTKKKCGVA